MSKVLPKTIILILNLLFILSACQTSPTDADAPVPPPNPAPAGKASIWDGTRPESYDFCFAWETDTQYFSRSAPRKYLEMNQWLVENAADWKVEYVIHTGDLINDYDMIYEWEVANEAMRLLEEAGIPNGVLAGNHDVGKDLLTYDNYHLYFGKERYEDNPWYGGDYDNNKGHYDLISAGGIDFIILYMSWDVQEPEMIDWMNQVLAEYSDRKAILCFHSYTNVTYDAENKTMLNEVGRKVQNQVVSKNPNVFLVLSGHYHGSTYETTGFDDDGDGTAERVVYQICTDYQIYADSGEGHIKFLYFKLDEGKIYMSSYSPLIDDFNVYDDGTFVELNAPGYSGVDTDKMVLDVSFHKNRKT